jgi:CDP-diacylglycerol--serine O-phosphatidyltransferase
MNIVPRAPLHDFHRSHGLTYASLACGLGAIATAALPNGHLAGLCLALAALADTFDGRFARLFARTERQAAIGGEIDSLVDACVFGMAPVIVLWMQAPPPSAWAAGLWWSAALLYVLAAVTRLGFFNLEDDARTFVGIPTPAIALVWSSVLLSTPSPAVVACVFVAAAAGMVAPIVIPRPRPGVLALFAGWAAALVVGHALGA